ncbi:hypothetical protein CC77DRAFT_791812 [Alternaria alternata]|uniref:Uncharacterized protein n=1 Tax=Alternaria alternata TaxID=5599 RepID=A0A177DQY8_ALTAL|nr:hypothetical protein CC77DRAFT_791812 [Alternaria alternata]OAG22223.1 hypothetical protein CC77DRAFT_791812 [Alternaria alternata]
MFCEQNTCRELSWGDPILRSVIVVRKKLRRSCWWPCSMAACWRYGPRIASRNGQETRYGWTREGCLCHCPFHTSLSQCFPPRSVGANSVPRLLRTLHVTKNRSPSARSIVSG